MVEHPWTMAWNVEASAGKRGVSVAQSATA